MNSIDKTKPILVTGANGYIASWLVKRLLDEGLTVHAAVRDPYNYKKISHLNNLEKNSSGKLIFFKADLLSPNSYKAAMNGCELIYHTASPFIQSVKNPQTELIDPAVYGTMNVLNSANETPSVKRIVLTSSCAAMYTDAVEINAIPNRCLTESIWNTTASIHYQPYFLSKTLAEKTAWSIHQKQTQWDLIAMNVSFVMGPDLNSLNSTTESLKFLTMLGNGRLKIGIPNIGVGIIDVRDVAQAHFKAGFTPHANGRYITSAYNTNFLELATVLLPKFGHLFPIPKRALPKWVLLLIGRILDPLLTPKFVLNNVNIPWKADNSKIIRDLQIPFRPLNTTMEDAFQALVESKLI